MQFTAHIKEATDGWLSLNVGEMPDTGRPRQECRNSGGREDRAAELPGPGTSKTST